MRPLPAADARAISDQNGRPAVVSGRNADQLDINNRARLDAAQLALDEAVRHPVGGIGYGEFPKIAARTIALWSSGDRYLIEAPVARSGEHVTGGFRYERIEDASHWLQLDAPERVNELLLDFLT